MARIVTGTPIDAARRLGEWLLRYDQQEPEQIVIGLCGGTSPFVGEPGFLPAFLEVLGEFEPTLVRKLRYRVVDERLYEGHNESLLRDKFFNPGRVLGVIEESQLELYPLEHAHTATHGIPEYWSLFENTGGRYDVVVLGTGPDGHVAGAFPEHVSTTDPCAKKAGFFYFDASPKPPNGRVTATLELLRRAKFGVLIGLGADKKEAMDRYFDTEVLLAECPAKIVDSMGETLVLTDHAPEGGAD